MRQLRALETNAEIRCSGWSGGEVWWSGGEVWWSGVVMLVKYLVKY